MDLSTVLIFPFSQVFDHKTSQLISIGTAGKSAVNQKTYLVKGDTLKSSEDIAPQNREILQTFVWGVGSWRHETPHHVNCKIRRLCGALRQLSTVQFTFKLSTFITFEGALFSRVYGFSLVGLRQKLKKAVEESLQKPLVALRRQEVSSVPSEGERYSVAAYGY